jgi:hypothetical protein
VKAGLTRTVVWAAGVVVCLGYYGFKTAHWTQTTAMGQETPLFPRWEVEVKPLQSPGGRWALSVEPEPSLAQRLTGVTAPPNLVGWLSPFRGPRRVTFLWPTGTWEAKGGRLRRLWRSSATSWDGEHRLRASGLEEHSYRLDLRTGRTTWLTSPDGFLGSEADFENDLYYEEDADMLAVLNSTLESGDEKIGFSKQKQYRVRDRTVYLLWSPWQKGKRHPIVAASDEAAPRQLRLVDDGVPIELGKDGRTLWFSRGNVLWRLDLRKRLPELLDQPPLPNLPEPPLE